MVVRLLNMDQSGNFATINREVSWLGFNHRVLQEAMSKSVPAIERLRFLGIFSNNLDEFFRVRVATLNRMKKLGGEARNYFEMDPEECLEVINDRVIELQEKFEQAFSEIVKELKEDHNIDFVDGEGLTPEDRTDVYSYYEMDVKPHMVPLMLTKNSPIPRIRDKSIFLAIKMYKNSIEGSESEYALLEVPETAMIPRFYVLDPKFDGDTTKIILIDDVIRMNLKNIFKIFDFDHLEAYTVKLTRDSELDIAEDISISLMDKLSKSVEKREKGVFVRFVYDQSIPEDLLDFLLKKFQFSKKQGFIAGGRYHNFKDFLTFPTIKKELSFPAFQPIPHYRLEKKKSLLDEIEKGDVLLHYPFHSFSNITDLIREAAIDPKVKTIKITAYRLSKNSMVVKALINAAKNGKKVVVVLELQARFDEKNNLGWSKILEENGVRVQFGVNGLKVHCKLILIERSIGGGKSQYFAHIGSGNFHEGNAKIYTDYSLLTANQDIAKEVHKVFKFLKDNYRREEFVHLWVAPYSLRENFVARIKAEMEKAANGEDALVRLKLNNLVDHDLVQLIYQANKVGVKFQCVIRGICSIIPGLPGVSENIEIRSVVGRFLEHSRVFIFGASGQEKVMVSSSDLMTRNLDKRVEVATPIYDHQLVSELVDNFSMYWKDNQKARLISPDLDNQFVDDGLEPFSAQGYMREYYIQNRD
ncbi:MAG: polyphosphate kinase [Luteibaculaceae bacterium]|jgi:polyphosphate kinase